MGSFLPFIILGDRNEERCGEDRPLTLRLQSLGSHCLCSFHEQKSNYTLDLGQGGAREVVRTLVCEAGPLRGPTLRLNGEGLAPSCPCSPCPLPLPKAGRRSAVPGPLVLIHPRQLRGSVQKTSFAFDSALHSSLPRRHPDLLLNTQATPALYSPLPDDADIGRPSLSDPRIKMVWG